MLVWAQTWGLECVCAGGGFGIWPPCPGLLAAAAVPTGGEAAKGLWGRQRTAPAPEPPSDKRAQEQEFIPVNMFALFILSIFINHNRRDICC